MTRKYLLALAALTFAGSLSAQDIYKVEMLSGSDLNGSARFVGMGGAMNALGADLSTMGTNPAAIGLYRRSDVGFSAGATVQPNGQSMENIGKSRASFDQAGFVYAAKLGGEGVKFLNFGFNYQKRRNLKNYIGLDNVKTEQDMSQSWQMMDLAYFDGAWLDLAPGSDDANYTTPLALVGYDTQMILPNRDADGKIIDYTPSFADRYDYHRVQWGGIKQYDFNLSMNFNDRLYGGFTIGVYDVDVRSTTEYGEVLLDDQNNEGNYYMHQEESLQGTGADVKVGFIFRPIETSPFRIGIAASTPIFFDLTQRSYLYMNSPYGFTDSDGNSYDRTEQDVNTGVDYKIRTPWRLNLSMGTTVGNYLALDAEYEYANYKGTQVRYPDAYDDYYYGPTASSTRDKAMDGEIDACLQAVHTVRLGGEVRLAKGLSARLGYNYVSAPMKEDAFLNLFTSSPSYQTSTNTDYVNLGAINRVTAGLGYRGKHFYADMAYQYQTQQGDVYAFHLADTDGVTNRLQGQKVDLNRHNVLFTIGYKF